MYVNVGQVTGAAVQVKAVADNKLRRNGEGHIVRHETGLGAFGLMEQGGETYGCGVFLPEVLDHAPRSEARVHYILYDYYVPALHFVAHAHELLHLAGGGSALVTGIAHKGYGRVGDAHLAYKVGGENERAGQHAEKEGALAVKVPANLSRHTPDLGLYLLARKERSESQSVDSN